jgi:hypothetical protein
MSDNSFNLLPMDVIKLIIDEYYTPEVYSFEEENRFYVMFEYPWGETKLEMPLPKGSDFACILYEIFEVEMFIEDIKNNVPSKICLTTPEKLTITLDEFHICISREYFTVKIKNTQRFRKQFEDVMIEYVEYVDNLNECYSKNYKFLSFSVHNSILQIIA